MIQPPARSALHGSAADRRQPAFGQDVISWPRRVGRGPEARTGRLGGLARPASTTRHHIRVCLGPARLDQASEGTG